MAVDARYRDKDGEISRTCGKAHESAHCGCANDAKLSDVLANLDELSLFKLVRDHKAGMLPISCDVRYWHKGKADIALVPQCPLMTQSGHGGSQPSGPRRPRYIDLLQNEG